MPTNAEQRNHLSRLLGGDASKDQGARDLMQNSPFNLRSLQGGTGPYQNSFFTHFGGATTIPPGLVLTSEGTTTAAATYGIGLGGEGTITSDDVAQKTEQLSTQPLWQANRQPAGSPLVAEVRWKTGATITASEYWVAITDGGGASVDTDPIRLSSTSTFTTSVPTDGIYMGYSATPTSGAAFTSGGNQHAMVSILADANTVVGVGGGTFVAATYYTYRLEIDVDGTARFYLNGGLLGTQASAVTATVPLALSVWAAPRTTVSAAVTIDYMGIWGA